MGEVAPLGCAREGVITVESTRANCCNYLPDIWTTAETGAATSGAVAEDDPGMILHAHTLVDVALGEA